MEDRTYITVQELNFYLNRIVDQEELLHDMYVLGEVSGCSIHKGNLYCTLKDENAQISAICFAVDKTYVPESGEQVLMYGTPSYYEKTGKMSFVARRIEPFGRGKLHLELELTKKKLYEEGLFSDVHKTPSPKYSKNVCIVTSISGAVIHDIYTTVRKYNKLINLAVVNVSVQGKEAEKEIVKGLKLADRGGFDTVILARGGGSFEDLMPFNSEAVCRALYDMDTYVISAVGHETDVTLADLVADARALTPTAAAELIAFDTSRLADDVIGEIKHAGRKLENAIKTRQLIATDLSRKANNLIGNKLNIVEGKLNSLLNDVKITTIKSISQKENKLTGLINKIDVLNPLNLLKSGYFKPEKEGKPVNSIDNLHVGDVLTLQAYDGTITSTINGINKTRGTK